MGAPLTLDRAKALAAAGPELETMRAELAALAGGLRRLAAWGGGGMAAFMLAAFFLPGGGFLVFVGLVAGGLAGAVALLRVMARIHKARAGLMAAAAPALGLRYEARPSEDFGVKAAFAGTAYESLVAHARVEDALIGERGGVRFQLFDMVLRARSKGPDGRWRPSEPPAWLKGVVFSALHVVRVEAPGRWTARAVLIRDQGIANRLMKPKGMSRVRLVDPKFEALFEVYADDQTEARAFLHPVFMERLMRLEALFTRADASESETSPVAVFHRGAFMVAMPLKPPVTDPLNAKKVVKEVDITVERLLDEMEAVLGVADALLG